MDELILSEEEKKLVMLYRIIKASKEKKSSLNDDPSQVRIQVTEEMTFGERIGG